MTWMPWKELSIALITAGIIGIVAAFVLVKLGFGQPIYDTVSKASRAAIRAVTRRMRRRA